MQDTITALETQLNQLLTRQKQQEEAGDYPSAQKTEALVLEMQQEIKKERGKFIVTMQLQQKIELETKQLGDFETFKGTWDKRVRERKENERKIVEEAVARGKKELEELRQRLETTLSVQPRPSGALLSLRDTERRAAKAKHYQEAQFCKARAAELAQFELEQHLQARNEKIQHELDLRSRKIEQEIRNLQQRLNLEETELLRSRTQEADALVKKFQNAKAELEVTQGLERNRVEGKQTTGAGSRATHSQVIARLLQTPTKGRTSSRATHRSAG